MTDLIKFLRTSTSSAFNKVAADRIEELVKERDEAQALQSCACNYDTPTDVCMGHHALFERLYAAERAKLEAKLTECEARLSKAVEALRVISQFGAVTNSALNVHAIFKMADRARAVLAELEGEE